MNSANSPLVSVILPVYNSEKYLGESVAAILDQTFMDFEFIIINDGSKDRSEEKILEFKDPRIRYIKQENAGLAATLNNGIAVTKGKYIARQDHDDISLPERLEKQVRFMESHPKVGLLGSWAEIINEEGKSTGHFHKHPSENHVLKFLLLFNNPFVHSSVMIRKEVLERSGVYDTRKDVFEDHNLWSRMASHTELANLPEVLLKYRELNSSMSRVAKDYDDKVINQSIKNLVEYSDGRRESEIRELVNYQINRGSKDANLSRLFDLLEDIAHNLAKRQGINFKLLQKELQGTRVNMKRSHYNSVLNSEESGTFEKLIARLQRKWLYTFNRAYYIK
jgi:glycosyltransferase involved in cell wall biosynthesis